MTEREKLEAVAESFTSLMALRDQQNALIGEIIRQCVAVLERRDDHGVTDFHGIRQSLDIRSKNREDKALAIKALKDVAARLSK